MAGKLEPGEQRKLFTESSELQRHLCFLNTFRFLPKSKVKTVLLIFMAILQKAEKSEARQTDPKITSSNQEHKKPTKAETSKLTN